MVQVVLFDIDGTLIRTGGAGVESFSRASALVLGRPNVTHGIHFHGRTDTGIWREILQKEQLPQTNAEKNRFFEAYLFLLDERLRQNPGKELPGVRSFIHDLQGLPNPPLLGLLTGNIRVGAELKLRAHGLWNYFHTGAFGDDHEDRNRLAAIAQERSEFWLSKPLNGSEIIIVGDTPHDIACAQAINAKSLAVTTGDFTSDDLRQHQPTWISSCLGDIPVKTLVR